MLVNHSYGKENNLRSQEIAIRLVVVGSKGDPQDGVLYELTLVDNDDSMRKMWGFGVEIIMEPTEPVDFSPHQALVPTSSN